MLCWPLVLVSKGFMETTVMYDPDIPYRSVKLWDRKSGMNGTYFIPILEEIECISERTTYNTVGNRIAELVSDFVESLLRRKIRGIRLEKVRMDCR